MSQPENPSQDQHQAAQSPLRDWLGRVDVSEDLPEADHYEIFDGVVVAGAGPSGLAAAIVLASAGISVIVLEKLDELSQESRASTFHPATLELLNSEGLADPVIANGLKAPRTQFRDRLVGPVATFDLGVLSDETEFPFRIQLEQSKFTAHALSRLNQISASSDSPAEVRFGHRVHRASQDGEQVALLVGTESGLLELRAPYVIAADGAHSALRDSLGISLRGEEYPERFLVVSVANELSDYMDGLEYVNYVADPDQWLVLLRTPDHWRILFPITETDLSDDEVVSDEESLRRLNQVVDLGSGANSNWQILEQSLYVVSRRVADSMRVGRVLLAGDAAHQNSPLGGMGMNSGIQDAFSAARRLTKVINSERSGDHNHDENENSLNEYARLRRDVAVGFVQADSHANWLALREPDPVKRSELQADLKAIEGDPVRHADKMRRSAMLETVAESL